MEKAYFNVTKAEFSVGFRASAKIEWKLFSCIALVCVCSISFFWKCRNALVTFSKEIKLAAAPNAILGWGAYYRKTILSKLFRLQKTELRTIANSSLGRRIWARKKMSLVCPAEKWTSWWESELWGHYLLHLERKGEKRRFCLPIRRKEKTYTLNDSRYEQGSPLAQLRGTTFYGIFLITKKALKLSIIAQLCEYEFYFFEEYINWLLRRNAYRVLNRFALS